MADWYRLGDFVPNVSALDQRDYRGTVTGEFRAPKKGEWYLSGAIPTVYRAPNDLSTNFMICRIAKVKAYMKYEEVK